MSASKSQNQPLSWDDFSRYSSQSIDFVNGPTNAYSTLRLFGQPLEKARVTLYRDNHAWCPYCQKVWLWLEWKQIPYKVKKITMRCYGQKETWYLKKVPSGMLPAIEIDKNVITESDDILIHLERKFGPLGSSLEDPKIFNIRTLERTLFRSWCIWLCNPSTSPREEDKRKQKFLTIATELNNLLESGSSPWLDPYRHREQSDYPGCGDVIFIPYVERMNASLAYYKGLSIREEFPGINTWFKSLEELDVYRGTQSDFHTHSHDLPPQMGGCWADKNSKQEFFSTEIDNGQGLGKIETSFSLNTANDSPESIALSRILKHRDQILKVNPLGPSAFDQPLRAALTKMVLKIPCNPTKGSAKGLRYLRDRVSVPRDMPLLSARKFRQALEKTAQLDGPEQGFSIPKRNRFDQNPDPFRV